MSCLSCLPTSKFLTPQFVKPRSTKTLNNWIQGHTKQDVPELSPTQINLICFHKDFPLTLSGHLLFVFFFLIYSLFTVVPDCSSFVVGRREVRSLALIHTYPALCHYFSNSTKLCFTEETVWPVDTCHCFSDYLCIAYSSVYIHICISAYICHITDCVYTYVSMCQHVCMSHITKIHQYFLFGDKVLLCGPDWPQTHSVFHAGLEFTDVICLAF